MLLPATGAFCFPGGIDFSFLAVDLFMQLMFPWFLVGLVAVALPIVIHLLQLRRPQRFLFTNTAFIREVELVRVKQRNVQRWLLLLTRILGLVALIFLFCQPFIPARKNALLTSGADILVDNSFSMQAHGFRNAALFTEELGQIRGLNKLMPNNTRIRLLNSTTVNSSTTSALQNSVDAIKLNHDNPFSCLRGELLDRGRDRNFFYIFSDFQKNQINKADLLSLRNQQVLLLPLVSKGTGNLYVDSVWIDDAFVRLRSNIILHVRVRNGGTLKVKDSSVRVFLGNRQAAAFRVTVEPGQVFNSIVQVQIQDDGFALGRVVTEDSPVSFDNIYYFTLHPAAVIRVLEIGAEPTTQLLYRNEPLFSYFFAKPQNVNYGVLNSANLVLVRELARLDAGLREGLRNVAKRGGSVVVVPSPSHGSRDSYQLLFRELGLGTVQWEGRDKPDLREVAMPTAREPFFRDVLGAQQRAVTMPRVAPVLRWSRTGTDILRLRDGESFLSSFMSGTGQVYVFSAPFAQQYSDFSTHVLFVPVMYRLAMLSYRNEQLPAYRITQGAVTLQLPIATTAASASERADETSFRLVRDSVVLIPTQRLVGSELRLEVPPAMAAAGFYEVRRGEKVLTTLAFNPDKRESELAAYSADELRQLLGANHPNIKVVESGMNGEGLATLRAEQTGQPLWRYCLAIVLLALLAEALLIRFGGRSAAARSVAVAA